MAKVKDPRIPNVGAVITRKYKGQTLEVTVADDGFVHDGQTWTSLSKLAAHVCGQKAINGYAFFKLGKKTKGTTPEVVTTPKETTAPEVVVTPEVAIPEVPATPEVPASKIENLPPETFSLGDMFGGSKT